MRRFTTIEIPKCIILPSFSCKKRLKSLSIYIYGVKYFLTVAHGQAASFPKKCHGFLKLTFLS